MLNNSKSTAKLSYIGELAARLRDVTNKTCKVIKSNYINDILPLLLESDEEGLLARQQIAYLTDKNFDYTGSGFFVTFEHSPVLLSADGNYQSFVSN